MSNRKRNKGRHQQKTHTVHFPHVGLVTFPPSRASKTPFYAYYGPNEETCPELTGLEEVFTLPCIPPVKYFACPLHYGAVYQMVQRFLARLATFSEDV
ncbi:MAG TPA: hypothetical protein VJ761_17120 [Ktedonobacteraceae bacterium]|nr:hypothetical protein [Ktedonobacteraceae bacterium]